MEHNIHHPDRTAALVQFATRHAQVSVPVLPNAVRDQLRALGLPVRLFGENLAQVRERLRQALAQRHVLQQGDGDGDNSKDQQHGEEEEPEEVTQYTRAAARLIDIRTQICQTSIQHAMDRLAKERIYKAQARKRKYGTSTTTDGNDTDQLDALDRALQTTVQHTFTLQGSQYADARAIAGLVVVNDHQHIVTGSWNASLRVWDPASLSCVATRESCHEDRIMGLAASSSSSTNSAPTLLCSTSLDRTAKIWKLDIGESSSIHPVATLAGHAQRLAQAAFHPHVPNLVATTSYDHTWRLWDTTAPEQQLLLQDGHASAVHGLAWHPDGSLCVTTDTLGVVHAWDLRTGQSIRHWMTPTRSTRVVQCHCPANGLQLVTGDTEGVLRVWDWRRPKRAALVIPAHGNAITRIMTSTSSSGGGCMATSSFDGTIKLWNPSANYQCVTTLEGHDGKVSGVDFVSPTKLVSCGHDKTLKVWC